MTGGPHIVPIIALCTMRSPIPTPRKFRQVRAFLLETTAALPSVYRKMSLGFLVFLLRRTWS